MIEMAPPRKYRMYMLRRPRYLAAGIVNSTPIIVPMPKALVASAFHCSASTVALTAEAPADARFASPTATTGMKALTLHQTSRLIIAIDAPLNVNARYAGVNNCEIVAGRARSTACFQRSGSLIIKRTASATIAGIRPERNTYRQATSGTARKYT